MISSLALSKDDGGRLADPTEYRSLAGVLQYVVLTQPDISYTVNRYLRRTIDHGLIFWASDRLSLVGYADANWGLDFDDRRFTTKYYVYFGHTPISWCSKKQQVVSRLIAEAEYRSLAAAASDVTWFQNLLRALPIEKLGEC
ncbi:hypothetical protein PVK06_012099 [Gossypium arboreum]|uniref:Uncharacterized protein n=1 Tax=Gossypium arboreum TaxID=29729 RepID=A0ABR0QB87_GOSAR|nr:hypothetical protein PVK06_012099 [Gossypium arboreum]